MGEQKKDQKDNVNIQDVRIQIENEEKNQSLNISKKIFSSEDSTTDDEIINNNLPYF